MHEVFPDTKPWSVVDWRCLLALSTDVSYWRCRLTLLQRVSFTRMTGLNKVFSSRSQCLFNLQYMANTIEHLLQIFANCSESAVCVCTALCGKLVNSTVVQVGVKIWTPPSVNTFYAHVLMLLHSEHVLEGQTMNKLAICNSKTFIKSMQFDNNIGFLLQSDDHCEWCEKWLWCCWVTSGKHCLVPKSHVTYCTFNNLNRKNTTLGMGNHAINKLIMGCGITRSTPWYAMVNYTIYKLIMGWEPTWSTSWSWDGSLHDPQVDRGIGAYMIHKLIMGW